MDEHNDALTVPRASESTVSVPHTDETLVKHLGGEGQIEGSFCGGEDGGEIMVEVVGSDVFVDGVGGDHNRQNSSDEREIGTTEGECPVIDDLEPREVQDSGGQTVLQSFQDISWSSGERIVKEEAAVVVSEAGLERPEELPEGSDPNCVLSDPSVHGAGVMDVETFNCGSKVGAKNSLVVAGLSSGESQVGEEGVERTVESVDEVGANHLKSEIGVLSDKGWNPGIESGVIPSSLMARPRTTEAQVVPEEAVVMVRAEGLNSKDEVHSNAVDVKSPCLGKDGDSSTDMIYLELDYGATRANAEFADHQAEGVGGEDGMAKREVSFHMKSKFTESKVVDVNLQSSVDNEQMDIKMIGTSFVNQANLEVNSISFPEPAKVNSGNSETIDNKLVVSYPVVHVSGEKEVLTTNNRGFLGDNINLVGEDEQRDEASCEISRTDVAACTNIEDVSKKIQVVNDNEVNEVDSMLENPQEKVPSAEIEAILADRVIFQNVKSETTCTNAGNDVEQICLSKKREVLVAEVEKASDFQDRGSGTDALGAYLSCSEVDQQLEVEKETVGNSSKSDVSVHKQLDFAGQILVGHRNEATEQVLTSTVQVLTAGKDGISGCSEDLQNMKCEPGCTAEKDIAIPTNATTPNVQAPVTDTMVVAGGSTVEDGVVGKDPHLRDTSITENTTPEEFKDEKQKAFEQQDATTTSEPDQDKNLNPLNTDVRIIEEASEMVLPCTDGDVACGPQAMLPEDGVVGKDPHLRDKSITENITPEEFKDEKQKAFEQQDATPTGEPDQDKNLNPLNTDVRIIEEASEMVLPCTVGDVACDPQASLRCDVFYVEGKSAHSYVNNLPSHLSDSNQNAEVNVGCNDISLVDEEETMGRYVTEQVTSNEIENLTFDVKDEPCITDNKRIVFPHTLEATDLKNSDKGSILGSSVEDVGTYPNEEGMESEGGYFQENVPLPHEVSSIHADHEGVEGDVELQFSQRLCGSAPGDNIGASSDLECSLGGEERYTDEEQVDTLRMQDTEVQDLTAIEQSTSIDEKTTEQTSSNPGSSVLVCQSCYLPPPKTEGEFSVGDLVWGKVRSHPWWPGQIFDPADASEKAMKYHKKDCFLVAYFGDRTFAWNDASLLRPFRMHFSQIVKQSHSEAFHYAVRCALNEVFRRVEFSLACSCISKDALDEIESQIVENAGIQLESGRRNGGHESSRASYFEPKKLSESIQSLALFPSSGVDQLELVIAKAQLSAFTRFKGYRQLPEYQLCGGLVENDANTSELSDVIEQHSDQIKIENNSSNKRKRDLADSLQHSRKKDRSLSELMGDSPHSSDCEDEPDGNIIGESNAGKKRKAIDSASDGPDKRVSFYAAKVSTTASQIPKPSFKVGECIRRVASQLTGSPSLMKCNSEKFLKVDDSVDQHVEFDVSLRTPVNSQRGSLILPSRHSSLDVMLSQLHLAARDPLRGYSFLNTITTFFSGFRHSIALNQHHKRQNISTGRGGGRKKKVSHADSNTPEEFEFDDVNDSYWTDRIVHNYAEEQLLPDAHNREGEHQLVANEQPKPQKSGQKSQKRYYSVDHELDAEESEEHIDRRMQDLSPTELILNFTEGKYVPSEVNLNKMFRHFGPVRESETEVDRHSSRARVVFKRRSDAEVAFNSAGIFNIFGPTFVNYELSYVPSLSFKTLPLATLQKQEELT